MTKRLPFDGDDRAVPATAPRRAARLSDRSSGAFSVGCRFSGAAFELFVLALLGLPSGCRQAPPPAAPVPPPARVIVAHPTEEMLAATREYTGHLEAVETVMVRARVRGILQSVKFRDGAEVQEGDLLYEIDPTEYEAVVAEKRAELNRLEQQEKLAASEAKRSEELFRQNAASEETLDAKVNQLAVVQAELQRALATLRQAELSLSYTKIDAPISGRVGRTLVTVGNLVGFSEPTLLTTIVKMDPIYVQFDIPERDLLTYEQAAQEEAEEGDGSWSLMQAPLAVGLETETGYPHAGVISFRDNRVDNETGTAYLRGSLPNADRKLIPGLFCRVQVPVGEPKPRLLVPETALAADQAGRFVLVVNKDDTVEQRRVEIESGMGKRGFLSIAKGVTASDRIIVSGIQKGRPGSKVAAEFASAAGTTPATNAATPAVITTPATATTPTATPATPAAEPATQPSGDAPSGANPSGAISGDTKAGDTKAGGANSGGAASGDMVAPASGGKG